MVTRISIDVLRSARARREEYVGPWLPEPLLSDPYQDPARSAELADSLSMAALLLLERLTPLERAVFVLLTQRRRLLQRIRASPSKIGDIAKAALVLTHFEHGRLT